MDVERIGEVDSSSSVASFIERKKENGDVRQSSSELSSLEDESSLSSLSDNESLDDDEDDDDDEQNIAGRIRVGSSLRDLTKVSITPHRRAEKHGRPTRRTAAAASSAWSHLTPRALERQAEHDFDTLDDVRSPSSASKKKRRTIDDRQPSTPSKVRQTPKKRKEHDAAYSTPSKASKTAVERTPNTVQFARKPQAESDRAEVDARHRGESLIRPTSSDAYFANHAPGQSRRNQTSNNLISHMLPAISSRAVMNLGNRIAKNVASSLDNDKDGKTQGVTAAVPPIVSLYPFVDAHEQWWSMLCACNRPLLFYGVGSKKAPLQRFARDMARQGRCCVVVVRGEAGGRIEEVVSQLERICSISPVLDVSRARRMAASSALEARVEHIVHVLHEEAKDDDDGGGGGGYIPPSIMLLLHNIDAPALMQEKSLRLLGRLSQSRRIHVCADTVHLNVAMLAGIEVTPYFAERLRWLWIDLTTYIPLLDETIGEKGAGIGRTLGLPSVLDVRRAGAGSDAAALAIDYAATTTTTKTNALDGQAGLLTDRAAMHILRSVTFKARGLFLLLAARLLQQQREKDAQGATSGVTSTPNSILYTELTDLARSNFLAMTTDALRALLVEFTTHGLIYHGSDAKVQIKLSRGDLQHVVDTFASGRGE